MLVTFLSVDILAYIGRAWDKAGALTLPAASVSYSKGMSSTRMLCLPSSTCC